MTTLHTANDPRKSVPNPMNSGLYRTVPMAAVILGFAVVSFYYGDLPDQVPLHFGLSGNADSYGPKALLWILPVINLGLFYLLGLSAKTSYKLFNYPVKITEENAAIQHRIALDLVAIMRLLCCLMIAYLVYAIVWAARSGGSSINMWVLGGFLLAIFGSIIYFTRAAKLAA